LKARTKVRFRDLQGTHEEIKGLFTCVFNKALLVALLWHFLDVKEQNLSFLEA